MRITNFKLILLAAIASASLAWAILQAHSSADRGGGAQTGYLLQGVDPDAIGRIVLGPADKATTLVRQDEGFVVANLDNYPADATKVTKLLDGCLSIETVAHVTSSQANHADLEVTRPTAGTYVEFQDAKGQRITGVAVGQEAPGSGRYVRALNSDDVYIAKNTPWVDTAPLDYVNRDLLQIDRTNARRIVVSTPDSSYALRVRPGETPDIVLEHVPDGRELKTDEADAILMRLGRLSFDGVVRASQPAIAGLKFDHRVTVQTGRSIRYEIELARSGGKYYAKLSAVYTGAPVVKERRVESQAELKAKEQKLLAIQDADTFTRRHDGWAYVIADYVAKDLTTNLANITEPLQPKTQPATRPASTSSPTVPARRPAGYTPTISPLRPPAPSTQPAP